MKGIRGEHLVDVLVSGRTASIDQTWIVECKHWKSRVQKAQVATLVSIVQDVGADRGLLLSESGFQSGARSFARLQNVTLTNLKALRSGAADDITNLGLETCRDGLLRLQRQLHGFTRTTRSKRGSMTISARGRASMDAILTLTGRISIALSAIDDAQIGRWPVTYFRGDDYDSALAVQSAAELLAYLSADIAEIRAAVSHEEFMADVEDSPT